MLLGGRIDPELTGSYYEDSGGNPFYLEQLARSPRSGEPAADSAALGLAEVDVPGPVAGALREELALLSPDPPARCSREHPWPATRSSSSSPPPQPTSTNPRRRARSTSCSRSDSWPTDVPRRFRFRHPLVRRAVYASTPPGWILGAHARCAVELARRGARPTVRAHHVEYAAHHGDTEAIDLLREAGEERGPAGARDSCSLVRSCASTPPRSGDARAAPRIVAGARKRSRRHGRVRRESRGSARGLELTSDGPIATWVELTVACAGVEHALTNHARPTPDSWMRSAGFRTRTGRRRRRSGRAGFRWPLPR